MAPSPDFLHLCETILLEARATMYMTGRLGGGKAYLTNRRLLWIRGPWWLSGYIFLPPPLVDVPLNEIAEGEKAKGYWGPRLSVRLKNGQFFQLGLSKGFFFWPDERDAITTLWKETIEWKVANE